MPLPGILNVNSDGTGASIVCPVCCSHSNIDALGYPPQATQIKSVCSVCPFANVTYHLSFSREMLLTSAFILTFTLYLSASRSKQLITVSEESVTGNILPSDSVFNFTPRSRNHLMVSSVKNW